MIVFVLCEFVVHAVVIGLVYAIVYLFKLGYFTTTLLSQWTVFTIAFAAAIGLFFVSFAVGFYAFK